jgi:TolB-like protein/Tfp pilus assembly protein PilF
MRTVLFSSATAFLALLVGLNIGGVRKFLFSPGTASFQAIRLAVLPFANLSGDPDQEYFSDGITQEMISQLGRLHPQNLSVIARTSVMRYKTGDVPIDRIGRELNVDYVLEGSARREGSRVKVTAELIQVRDQTQLWAETYERELSGILALQNDVAGKVAGALALKLLPAEQAKLARGHIVDPEAYEAFLRGYHYRQTMTRGGLEAAERYFSLAKERDPSYAAAWAGIAGVWITRQQMGVTPPKEAFSKAREAALKALKLDPSECEARRVMAGILTWGDWNWEAAERAWNRVFEINPDYTTALSSYSHFLMVMGRQDEAMAKIERAQELDPFDIKTLSFHSMILLFARRYDEAIAMARKALKFQSDAPVARMALIGALFMKSMFAELMAIERSRWAKDRNLLEALEQGYAEGGYPNSQKRLADALAVRYGTPGGVTAYSLANMYAFAGQGDRVIEWLERAYDTGDGNMPYIGHPVFDLVRSDPRFQSLRKRIGLPPGKAK